MPANERRDIDERVASLESEVRGVVQAVNTLAGTVDRLANRTPNYSVWLAVLSLIATVVISAGSLVGFLALRVQDSEISRVNDSLSQQIAEVARLLETHVSDGHPARVERHVAQLAERGTEIETQIDATEQVRNIQYESIFRLLNEERRDSGHEPFEVPRFFSGIASREHKALNGHDE